MSEGMSNEPNASGAGSQAASAAGGALRSRATRGTVWTTLSYGGSQVLRLVGNVILTRLLFEEAFGMMALVWVFMQGLALFSDIGIGPSIIQHKRGDEPSFLNTAWTIQVGRGALLWLAAVAFAVPFARIYGEPMLAPLLPVAGFSAAIAGFYSTKLFSMNRHLTVGRISLIEIASQALGLVVMVVWALFHRSVWALVVGGLATPFFKLVLLRFALPGLTNRFAWSRDDARALFSFGRWIFVSTAMTFLASQSDRLVFGKLIPLAMLGVYQIAVTLASVPSLALEALGSKIVFPLFSRVHNEGGDLPASFRRVRLPVLVVAAWVLSGFAGGGDVIIDILYDDRYAQAGWIVQLLSVGAWFSALDNVYKSALLARGRANVVAGANLGKLAGMLVFIPLGFHLLQFPGAVIGLVAAELCRVSVSIAASRRAGFTVLDQDLGLTALMAAAGGAGWLVAAALGEANVVLRAAAVFVVVTALWAPLVARYARGVLGRTAAPADSAS
jgi:O-antigen/teichoic acid export membrane protein